MCVYLHKPTTWCILEISTALCNNFQAEIPLNLSYGYKVLAISLYSGNSTFAPSG